MNEFIDKHKASKAESVGQEPVHTQKELSMAIEELKGLWPGDENSFHEFMRKVTEHAGVIRDLRDWDDHLKRGDHMKPVSKE